MTEKNKAVVLVSGGMDSLVTAALASLSYVPSFLHLNYGQRTESRELKAFNEIADFYSVKNRLVSRIDPLKHVGGSSLTDEDIPIEKADLDSNNIPSSYVPFRNAHFLAAAVSWAEVLGASAVFIGAVEEDSSGYPDCKREFYDAFEKAVDIGTKPDTIIKIITPIINMRKSEIIKKGVELNTPLELSWSCYQNNDVACGECDSCAIRLRAFKEAGVVDPISYVT